MGSPGQAVTIKKIDGTEAIQPGENLTFAVNGASGLTVIAASPGNKHRIYKITITADTAGTITISDGFGAIYHIVNAGIAPINFGVVGHLQDTANIAITITNSGGGNVSAHGAYKTESA